VMEERELPVGWVEAPIGELCDLRNGRAFKPVEWADEGTPIVRIQNLNKSSAKFKYYQGEIDPKHVLNGGELLFAWSGTPGTSFGAHIWEGGGAALNQHIFRVDFDIASIDKSFFRFAINQKLNDLIDIAHGGVGLRHVTKGKFEATEISLPPLNEQRRIAAKLDTTLAAVDACRQRLDGVADLLKRFRQAVLAAATSGELTREWREENPEEVDASSLAAFLQSSHELSGGHKQGNAAAPTDGVHDLDTLQFPNGWCLAELRDVVRPDRPITYGILKPGPELEEGIPYIRVADFPGDRLSINGIRKTSFEIDQAYKRSRLKAGDLLLSIRGTVGRLISIPPELEGANITQDTARLSVQEELSVAFVKYALHSELLQS
ncbi:MAG: restriction endonuclease subunit S, partial [Cyanobium sp.]